MLSTKYIPLTRQLGALSLVGSFRTFAISLAVKQPSSKPVSKAHKELKKAKDGLKSIQKTLSAKEKAINQAIKQRAIKQEKKIYQQATKKVRKLSAYTFFIKQQQGKKLVDAAQEWNNLSESQKSHYQVEADKFNQELILKFPPKPKAPKSSYAAFLQENYSNDGRTFAEIAKDISSQWKQLSDFEKLSYKPTQAEFDEYHQKLKAWTESRLENYKKQISESN